MIGNDNMIARLMDENSKRCRSDRTAGLNAKYRVNRDRLAAQEFTGVIQHFIDIKVSAEKSSPWVLVAGFWLLAPGQTSPFS
jgi:hypothetical protein